MNTVTRGGEFEELVFRAISRELKAERLGLLPSACTVHRGKGYYAATRRSEIIVDVSIEVTLPGASHWSILWAWECKNYSHAIPVGEVEEFWAKLQQIGGANIKGGIATSGPLQLGALRFAQSQGLSVIRVLPDANVITLVASDGFKNDPPVDIAYETLYALTEVDFKGCRRLYGVAGEWVVQSWDDLFRMELPLDEVAADNYTPREEEHVESLWVRSMSRMKVVLEFLRRTIRE